MRRTSLLFAFAAMVSLGCETDRRMNDGNLDGAMANEAAATAPDDTAINRRDAEGVTKTPFDQSETAEDRERTAEIRRRVVDLPDASINARNVKIITAGGRVTLRGPVNSEAERDAIAKVAHEVAGEDNVDNQLEVTPE